jgi:hypothetical protein
VLLAVFVNAERHEHQMRADVDAVDHHGAKRKAAKVTAHHLGELLAGRSDEAATDRALARSARANTRWCRIQRPFVVARRDAEHHLLDRARGERVRFGEALPGLQRQLPPIGAAHPRTAYADARPPIASSPSACPARDARRSASCT